MKNILKLNDGFIKFHGCGIYRRDGTNILIRDSSFRQWGLAQRYDIRGSSFRQWRLHKGLSQGLPHFKK